jgi:hypothetical protein
VSLAIPLVLEFLRVLETALAEQLRPRTQEPGPAEPSRATTGAARGRSPEAPSPSPPKQARAAAAPSSPAPAVTTPGPGATGSEPPSAPGQASAVARRVRTPTVGMEPETGSEASIAPAQPQATSTSPEMPPVQAAGTGATASPPVPPAMQPVSPEPVSVPVLKPRAASESLGSSGSSNPAPGEPEPAAILSSGSTTHPPEGDMPQSCGTLAEMMLQIQHTLRECEAGLRQVAQDDPSLQALGERRWPHVRPVPRPAGPSS